jgi:hypothetical protein
MVAVDDDYNEFDFETVLNCIRARSGVPVCLTDTVHKMT